MPLIFTSQFLSKFQMDLNLRNFQKPKYNICVFVMCHIILVFIVVVNLVAGGGVGYEYTLNGGVNQMCML